MTGVTREGEVKPSIGEVLGETFSPEVVIGENSPQLLNINFDGQVIRKICTRLGVKPESLSGIVLKGGLVDLSEKTTTPIPEDKQHIVLLLQKVTDLIAGSYNSKNKIISIYPDNIVLSNIHASVQAARESKAPLDIVSRTALEAIKQDIGITIVEELAHSTQNFRSKSWKERFNPKIRTLRLEIEAAQIGIDHMDLILEAFNSTQIEYPVLLETLLDLAMTMG